MKKRLLILLCAISTLASCQKEIDSTGMSKNEVSFKSQISSQTRVTGSDFDSGDEIHVAALEGESIFAESDYIYDGAQFVSSTPIEKSSSGQELSYVATYPEVFSYSDSFPFTVAYDQSVEGAYAESDLLAANTGATSALQPTLVFSHKLSALICSFKLSDGSEAIPSSVSISAQSTAICNIATDSYFSVGDAKEITAANVGSAKIVVLPPQTIGKESTMTIDYEGVEYTATFNKEVEFESGYAYQCELTLDAAGESVSVEFIGGAIADWNYTSLDDFLELNGGSEEEEEATIGLEVLGVDLESILVKTTPSSSVENYVYGIVEMDYYESNLASDPEATSEAIVDIYQQNSIPLGSADGTYVLSGECIFDLGVMWLVKPDTEYAIFVFEVDASGNIISEITTGEATTLPLEDIEKTDDFAITLSEVQTNDVLVKVDKGSWDGNYIVAMEDPYVMPDAEAQAEATLASIASWYPDFSKPNNQFVYSDDGEIISLWEGKAVYPSVKYQVCGFGVSDFGQIATNASIVQTKTLPYEPTVGTLEMEAVGSTLTDIIVHVTPSADIMKYACAVMYKEDYYDKYEGDPTTAAQAMACAYGNAYFNCGDVDNVTVFDKESDVSLGIYSYFNSWCEIVGARDYVVVTFGYSDAIPWGMVTSDVAVVEVSTPEFTDTIEMSNFNAASIDDISFDITLSNEESFWYMDVASVDYVADNFGGDYLQNTIASLNWELWMGYDLTVPSLRNHQGSEVGVQLCDAYGLNYDTAYRVVVCMIDGDGHILSDLIMSDEIYFSSASGAPASSPASPDAIPAVNSAELQFAKVANKPLTADEYHEMAESAAHNWRVPMSVTTVKFERSKLVLNK